MVVQVKSNLPAISKAMDGNQNKLEANVLLLGAESVGKSGMTNVNFYILTPLDCYKVSVYKIMFYLILQLSL